MEIINGNKNKSNGSTFYCKTCQIGHEKLYVVSKGNNYCDKCVPKDVKDRFVMKD